MGLGQFLAYSGFLNGRSHGIELLLLIISFVILAIFPKPFSLTIQSSNTPFWPDVKIFYIISAILFLLAVAGIGIKQYAVNGSGFYLTRNEVICGDDRKNDVWVCPYEDIEGVSYDEDNHAFLLNTKDETKMINNGEGYTTGKIDEDVTGLKAKFEKLKYEALRDILKEK